MKPVNVPQREMSAFPWVIPEALGSEGCCEFGMTLRDYFAAQIISGIFAGGHYQRDETGNAMAKYAYKKADQLLEERGKNDSPRTD